MKLILAFVALLVCTNNIKGDILPETNLHPPVFSEHMYYGEYTQSDQVVLTKPITIKYGAKDDTVIQQNGYEDYFSFGLNTNDKSIVDVKVLKPLPKEIMEKTTVLIIEIEAENQGLTIPGRTALVMHLPKIASNENMNPNETSKCVYYILGSSHGGGILCLLFFLIALFVVANTGILMWYIKKNKVVINPTPSFSFNEIPIKN